MRTLSKLPNFRWCAGDGCESGQIPSGSKSTLVAKHSSYLIDMVQAGIRNGNAASVQHATASIAKHSTTRRKHVNNINALNKLTAKVSKRSSKQRKAVPSVGVWEEWRSTRGVRTHFAKGKEVSPWNSQHFSTGESWWIGLKVDAGQNFAGIVKSFIL
jgi:hypothetical protein